MGKPTWFPNRSDTKRPVQAQKRAGSLKFRIKVEEEFYYPIIKNKGLMVVGFIVDEILRVGFKNDKVTGA